MMRTQMRKQAGLSLVELMIGIALSLLLMLGVIQIFLSSKQTYAANTALSQVQEAGRFAMEFLTQDVRNAGYSGLCMGLPLNHLPSSTNNMWTLDESIEGWDDVNTKPDHLDYAPIAGTDAVFVAFAAGPVDVEASGANTVENSTIAIIGNTNVSNGAITLISDAIACDLFRNGSSSGQAVSKDEGLDWSHEYSDEMEILPLQNTTYYLSDQEGVPALYRERLSVVSGAPGWGEPEILVEGIEDMQILYGVSDVNRQVTDYVGADEVTNWGNVAAVRIDLLVVSQDTNVLPENQSVDFNGGTVEISDRRLAQVFSTTIGIRNRLP